MIAGLHIHLQIHELVMTKGIQGTSTFLLTLSVQLFLCFLQAHAREVC
jgi:hypothetical protein